MVVLHCFSRNFVSVFDMSIILTRTLQYSTKLKEKIVTYVGMMVSRYVDRERDEPGMTRPTKMVPLLQQHPNESYRKFLKRVDRVTNVGGQLFVICVS